MVVVTLLVGVFGTIVLAASAGARRSSSAVRRFNDYARSTDLEVDVPPDAPPAQIATFESDRRIKAVGAVQVFAMSLPANRNIAIVAPVDDKMGNSIERSRILEGRRANPDAADEVTIGEGLAHSLNLRVGSTLAYESLTPEQLQLLFENKDAGAPKGPAPPVRVVGIERRPFDLGNLGASGGIVVLTRGFDRTYGEQIGHYLTAINIRLKDPVHDLGPVSDRARALWGKSDFFSALDQTSTNRGAIDATNVLANALWIFAAVVAVASLVLIGLMLAREFATSLDVQVSLRAAGMTRRGRALTAAPRAEVIAIGGAALAVVGAIAASPLFPNGLARRADPDPGVHADWMVLGLGALAIFAFVVVIAGISAYRSAAVANADGARGRVRRQPVVDRASEAGLRPTIAHGLRMALQPTRGEWAVPRTSTFLGLAFSVAGITAILVFSASLAHLVDTPARFGAPYEFKVGDPASPDRCRGADGGVTRDPGVTDVAIVCWANVTINKRAGLGWTFMPIRGAIEPQIIEGRAPLGTDEVALGAKTLRALKLKIGDPVTLNGKDGYHIVGRAIFPRVLQQDSQALADGVLFAPATFVRVARMHPGDFSRYIVGRFAPGADHRAVLARLAGLKALQSPNDDSIAFAADVGVTTPKPPPEVDRLQHIGWVPPALALLLGFLAFMAVAHSLFISVRRRRRDLAMLKALGFKPNQVRATITWQGTAIALIGLLIGLPLGVLLGRFAWRLAADGIGVATDATIPVLALALMIPLSIVLVDLVALVRANAPARAHPAVALQAE
ncbi:MAG TPA: FtsX-like permease family protein [Acidimicrobiia bacterium]|nr:FtsX-like permease family protein [Acidimicrobiia bacterium]